MEAHPVPKNVLTVEFKLFGSLTVKQFFKILAGCMIALILFVSPLPKLITLPLAILMILTGIMAALMKDFEVRLMGIIKSIFVSPRYVWNKQAETPDVLKNEKIEKSTTAKKIEKEVKNDPDDVSLDKLLNARAMASQQTEAVAPVVQSNNTEDSAEIRPSSHFDRVYDEVFKTNSLNASISKREQTQSTPLIASNGLAGQTAAATVAVGPSTQARVNPVRNDIPRAEMSAPAAVASPSDVMAYNARLQELGEKLSKASPEEKQIITQEINTIYAQMKQVVSGVSKGMKTETTAMKSIYGVVVDNTGQPLPGTKVTMLTTDRSGSVGDSVSGDDGRFSMNIPESTLGEMIVDLYHPSKKFYEFKIQIEEGKLPAFKFRSQ